MTLDTATLTTKGTLLPTVDFSKVDEVGFVDLILSSGHGFGGYSSLGFIDVYGKAVPRK
jgi:hypothetical protein